MKGKIGYYVVEVPENVHDIKELWRTHVPTLSFIKYTVLEINYHNESKNFSFVLKPQEGETKAPRIICEWDRYHNRYTVKRNIQFTERDACKRLSDHIYQIIDKDTTLQDIDDEKVYKGMEFIKENYPELVVWMRKI